MNMTNNTLTVVLDDETTCIYETTRLPRGAEGRQECVIHPLTPERVHGYALALRDVSREDRLTYVLDEIVLPHIDTLPETPVSDDGAVYYAEHLLHIIERHASS